MGNTTVGRILAGMKRKLRIQGELSPQPIQTPCLDVQVIAIRIEKKVSEDYAIGTSVQIWGVPIAPVTIREIDRRTGELRVEFTDGSLVWLVRDFTIPIREVIERHFAVVIIDGKHTEVEVPADIVVSAGDVLTLSKETMQIVKVR